MKRDYQQGQILLIVILVMVTVLTVGLSVATRTITNTRTSLDAGNSEKAFSAAEAGIEQSLTNGAQSSGTFSNKATYQTTVSTISGLEFPLNNGTPILKDDSFDIWLSTYPTYANQWSGTMTLYWGQPGDTCTTNETTNTMAAIEVVVLRGTTAAPQVDRYAVDPCTARTQGAAGNRFENIAAAGGTISGKTYLYRKTIIVAQGLFVRIIPLYSSVSMAVRGCDVANLICNALPAQGTVIEALGTSETSQRKLVTVKRYPKLPTELFPYSFFAPQ
jgi:Tfp pilus assembly protein PilX